MENTNTKNLKRFGAWGSNFYYRAIKQKSFKGENFSLSLHCLLPAFKWAQPTLKFRKNGICFVLRLWTKDKRLFVCVGLQRHLFLLHSIPHSVPLFIPACPAVCSFPQTTLAVLSYTCLKLAPCAKTRLWARHSWASCTQFIDVKHLLQGMHSIRMQNLGGGRRAREGGHWTLAWELGIELTSPQKMHKLLQSRPAIRVSSQRAWSKST